MSRDVESECRDYRAAKRRKSNSEYYARNRDQCCARTREYRNRPGMREYQKQKAHEWYERNKRRYQAENAWVKAAIKDNGWTLVGFSEALGLPRSRASQWVQGLHKAPTELIERKLGIKKEDYLG